MSTIFSLNRSNEDPDDLEIELGGRYYPLKIRRSARSRSYTVSADTIKSEVRLGLPQSGNIHEALSFVRSKSAWLANRFSEAAPAVPIASGASIPFMGENHLIFWSSEFRRKPERKNGVIHVGGPKEKIARRVLDWLKAEARSAYQHDLEHYCMRASQNVPTLSVGDARRRWGSCSEKGSIRLNWRLVMAPVDVRRSVVAHEVAHLKHMNHSKAFYAHLDSIFEGDRRAADRWLKKHGSGLHLVGATSV